MGILIKPETGFTPYGRERLFSADLLTPSYIDNNPGPQVMEELFKRLEEKYHYLCSFDQHPGKNQIVIINGKKCLFSILRFLTRRNKLLPVAMFGAGCDKLKIVDYYLCLLRVPGFARAHVKIPAGKILDNPNATTERRTIHFTVGERESHTGRSPRVDYSLYEEVWDF